MCLFYTVILPSCFSSHAKSKTPFHQLSENKCPQIFAMSHEAKPLFNAYGHKTNVLVNSDNPPAYTDDKKWTTIFGDRNYNNTVSFYIFRLSVYIFTVKTSQNKIEYQETCLASIFFFLETRSTAVRQTTTLHAIKQLGQNQRAITNSRFGKTCCFGPGLQSITVQSLQASGERDQNLDV